MSQTELNGSYAAGGIRRALLVPMESLGILEIAVLVVGTSVFAIVFVGACLGTFAGLALWTGLASQPVQRKSDYHETNSNF